MLPAVLLPPIPALHLTAVTPADDIITVTLTSTQATAACPLCSSPATRVHSSYARVPTDLPWAGTTVRLVLTVRRFFCDNSACDRKLFCERLGPALRVYAHQTTRRAAALQRIGLRVGSKPGARLGGELGLPTSPTTVLRLMRQTVLPAAPTPRVLGLDDFALRKGQTYGTLLLDLERHCPIDLLPDRTVETVATWLRAHPGIEIISRDRATAYAEAATLAAPTATQVADRFHLVQNLSDAVQRLLDRFPGALQQVTEHLAAQVAQTLLPAGAPAPPGTAPPPPANGAAPAGDAPPGGGVAGSPCGADDPAILGPTPAAPVPTPPVTAGTLRTQQRFAAVKELQAQGLSQRAIARRLGLNRLTVRRYLVADAVPVRGQGHQMQSSARSYIPYLRRRWAEGEHNGVQLWEEVRQQGYRGSYSSLYRLLRRLFGRGDRWGGARTTRTVAPHTGTGVLAPVTEIRPLSARHARWLLLRPLAELTATETQQRAWLLEACPAAATAVPLLERFRTMVRERQGAELATWIAEAMNSGVAELRNFAMGLKRDFAAVQAGLTLIWSQGPVEGQVNRIKMLKRTMFGRAKFDLLRVRVLMA